MRLTSRARQRIDNLGDEFKQLRLLPKFHEVMRELKEQKKQAISPLLFKRTAGLFDPQVGNRVTLSSSQGTSNATHRSSFVSC